MGWFVPTPREVQATSDEDVVTAAWRAALRGLDLLNLTLADVRDGLGPCLAIYLLAVRGPDQDWNEATIGLVMTIAGVAGLVAQTPAGALIDRTRHKRAIVIAPAVTVSCLVLPWISNFYLVSATQAVAYVAGSVFAPALTGITLGIVGPRLFSGRVGRNEGFMPPLTRWLAMFALPSVLAIAATYAALRLTQASTLRTQEVATDVERADLSRTGLVAGLGILTPVPIPRWQTRGRAPSSATFPRA